MISLVIIPHFSHKMITFARVFQIIWYAGYQKHSNYCRR